MRDNEETFVQALVELVAAGDMTKGEAIAEYRREFPCGLMHCVHIGLIAALDRAALGKVEERK